MEAKNATKLNYIILVLCLLSNFITVNAQQTVLGHWKTIDDKTGEARSIVEIYKDGDRVYGRIKKVLKEQDQDKTCIYCQGENYNKPIRGLVIINNLEKEGDEYEGGTILDPENGKVYRCKIWLDDEDPNVLNVRGYIAFLYRTQQWIRV